jgi:hypothetical protein
MKLNVALAILATSLDFAAAAKGRTWTNWDW